ncbi:hypothetical protein CA830_22705 [Burkholderia multivorans]|nr:hypothetical protein CA831_30505 [Burkholderia multivorans]OXH87574.1 hypothetical protein CA830_22705 [Burkholderia multivorans]
MWVDIKLFQRHIDDLYFAALVVLVIYSFMNNNVMQMHANSWLCWINLYLCCLLQYLAGISALLNRLSCLLYLRSNKLWLLTDSCSLCNR